MSKTFLACTLFAGALIGCSGTTAVQDCGCPMINAGKLGDPPLPEFTNYNPRISSDGKKLAFSGNYGAYVGILDLTTLHVDTVRAWGHPSWCPYNPSKLYVGGNGVWTYEISSRVFDSVGPPSAGVDGFVWLQGSTPFADSFYSIDNNRLFIPQSQMVLMRGGRMLAQTRDGKLELDAGPSQDVPVDGGRSPFYLGGMQLNIPLVVIGNASFSPDGHRLAVFGYTAGGMEEPIYIIDVQRFIANGGNNLVPSYTKLDLMCRYCMFAGDPEFISDSTLAVTMYHDGDKSAPLYEVGLDGHIIRQLTFVH